MTLNHLNLCVPDVAAVSAFFTDFFGFRLIEEKGRGTLAILQDDAGVVLTLSNFTPAAKYVYPQDFHIGFFMETVEQVDALYERLSAAGHAMEHAPRKMRGAWMFYCRAFDTFLVEISHRREVLARDDAPADHEFSQD